MWTWNTELSQYGFFNEHEPVQGEFQMCDCIFKKGNVKKTGCGITSL